MSTARSQVAASAARRRTAPRARAERRGAAFTTAEQAAVTGDEPSLAAARSVLWTAILAKAFREATRAAGRGEADAARSWLLVREFRPPTRFSRASDDATLALDRLTAGDVSPRAAAAAIRHDLLDTYDSRLRTRSPISVKPTSSDTPRARRRWEHSRSGTGRSSSPRIAHSAGPARPGVLSTSFDAIAAASRDGRLAAVSQRRAERRLDGFRAAPLSEDELVRRAGQLDRFLQLVPIEYGRGVKDGRVTLEFEIQEAVTFRDGAEAAYQDLRPTLMAANAGAARALGARLDALEVALADASRGVAVAAPQKIEATTDDALELVSAPLPRRWKEAADTADFDVIAATLDRLQGPQRQATGRARSPARLEAYGIFELGPEQRLRGLAPSLFQEVEGYFWYGERGHDGLVQLIARKAADAELADDARGARRRPRALRAADRRRSAVARLGRHERGDHRLPRGPRGRPHPRGAHGEPRRLPAAASGGRSGRGRLRDRRERIHLDRSRRPSSRRSRDTARSWRPSSRSSRSACCS